MPQSTARNSENIAHGETVQEGTRDIPLVTVRVPPHVFTFVMQHRELFAELQEVDGGPAKRDQLEGDFQRTGDDIELTFKVTPQFKAYLEDLRLGEELAPLRQAVMQASAQATA